MKRYLPLAGLLACLLAAGPARAHHHVTVSVHAPYASQRLQIFSVPAPVAYQLGQAFQLQLGAAPCPQPQAPLAARVEVPASGPVLSAPSSAPVVGAALLVEQGYSYGFGLGAVDVRVEHAGVHEHRHFDLGRALREAHPHGRRR